METRSSKNSSKSAFNPFIFKAGDVSITITHNDKVIIGKVCSQALVNASAVWEKFLYPPWSKDGDAPAQALDFSKDDSEALLVLFNIAHLKFHTLHTGPLPYKLLYQVAILSDKYQCAGLVRPWLDQWLSEDGFSESTKPGQEGWLFIAWAFGQEKTFENLASMLVRSVEVNKKGECLRDKHPLPEPMPNGIIGKGFFNYHLTLSLYPDIFTKAPKLARTFP